MLHLNPKYPTSTITRLRGRWARPMVLLLWGLAAALLLGAFFLLATPPAVAQTAGAAWPPPQRTGQAGLHAVVTVYVDREDDNLVTACTAAAADCTLRGAIHKANSDTANIYTIYFSPTVTLIALLNPLPTITAHGTWVWGDGGVPRLDAQAMPAGDVFSVNANDVLITELSVVNGHNSGGWADVYLIGGARHLIFNNYLGTLPPGPAVTNCTPNPDGNSPVTRNSYYGIYVGVGVTGTNSTNNSAAYIYGNTIGCHVGAGIWVSGADYAQIGSTRTQQWQGNYIGLNTQSTPLTNGVGLALYPSGSNAPQFAQVVSNTIANNASHGIALQGTGTANTNSAFGNVIRGNRIGLAPNGAALGNGGSGVLLFQAAFQNVIGGEAVTETNVIVGNGEHGIALLNVVGNGVLGNRIGVDATDTARPNQRDGLYISGGEANLVGAAMYGVVSVTRGNLIAHNSENGVQLTDGTRSNLFLANTIHHNGWSGVVLRGGAHLNTLGSNSGALGDLNSIRHNQVFGIEIVGASTTTNTVQANDLLFNGGDGLTIQDGARGNLIGGHSPLTKNIVRGNTAGIYIFNAPANAIYYNDVYENTFYGVFLLGAGTTGNTISRTTIMSNTLDGIGESGGAGFNLWTEVSMQDNTGLGIDKYVSQNGIDEVQPPTAVFTEVHRSVSLTNLRGTGLNGAVIEVYMVAPDPSGMGEGKQFIGSAVVSGGHWTVTTGDVGTWCFTLTETVAGQSSEFGPNTCRQMLPFVRR